MEPNIIKTKRKRFLAFVFDIVFIGFLVFTIYMLFGLIFKIDSEGYQNTIFYPLLAIIILYMFFGELICKNTLGKYLFGIEIAGKDKPGRPSLESFIKRGLLKIIFPVEALVLLFSKSKRRLGDLWAKTWVVNNDYNPLKPYARLILGILIIIAVTVSLRISMGLAVKKTDFYNVAINDLKKNSNVKIIGLTKEVNQSRNTVNFIVPVSNDKQDRYARIFLEKNGKEWRVTRTEFIKQHILGFSYSFN